MSDSAPTGNLLLALQRFLVECVEAGATVTIAPVPADDEAGPHETPPVFTFPSPETERN